VEQVARTGNIKGHVSTAEQRRRKVQRIEESIRAREAVEGRIVVCLGLALTLPQSACRSTLCIERRLYLS
jgi:hypothetical protein